MAKPLLLTLKLIHGELPVMLKILLIPAKVKGFNSAAAVKKTVIKWPKAASY
jgi:hypothetical protein